MTSPAVLAAAALAILGCAAQSSAAAEDGVSPVIVPRAVRPPQLEQFLAMQPAPDIASSLARVSGFVQRAPDDGAPATEQTDVYMAYDDARLYVVFVAFDREPQKIRAQLDRREGFDTDEDQVGFYLDTFDDRRRAVQFSCNPVGVQSDSAYSEDTGSADTTFDTVWDSRGARTDRGYVVWMAIPFKSLRFRPAAAQQWRFAAWRWLARRSEGSWWPRETFRIRGILSQAAALRGFEGIAGARNMQFVPFGTWRAYRALDARGPAPAFVSNPADARAGIDAKFIIKDSLVLDLTAFPDFSQIESDEPQSVVNQRFEVYFPERRPFFTENAGYFAMPLTGANDQFLFTRRVADPRFGARLTGKLGAYSIGAFAADDRSPGESAPSGDALNGSRAYFDAVRVSRDLGGQSNAGAMYTERLLRGSFSRLFAGDSIVRLSRTWSATLVAARAWTRSPAGTSSSGGDVEAAMRREGRTFGYDMRWLDRSRDFHPDTGFIPRSDERAIEQTLRYTAHAVGPWLRDAIAQLYVDKGWNTGGGDLFAHANPTVTIDFKDPSSVSLYARVWNDVLRPADYPTLAATTRFDEHVWGVSATTSHFGRAGASVVVERGAGINYFPAAGAPPRIARTVHGEGSLTLRPSGPLTIATSYLLDEGFDPSGGVSIFSANVFRSKWSWQLSRALSVRVIGQYNSLIVNRALTSTATSRSFNGDVLIAYLLHPGTAFYIGYNSDLRRPVPLDGGSTADRFGNDGRQVFVKVSYLVRP